MWHNVKQKLRQTDKDSQDVWLNRELLISFLSGWTSITSFKKMHPHQKAAYNSSTHKLCQSLFMRLTQSEGLI